MKILLIELKTKHMRLATRLSLFRHRVDYWFYQHENEALFAVVAAGLVASQAILFVVGR